ncbi:hypothetical protein [Pedobacter aquatilis]|uniref:hypothetical protein n=1 Tax=Pedobacter aquatilis TaxID=351343 RepID=UPI0029307233|nr:hypothetical protein [Pedobacter aquatilis]
MSIESASEILFELNFNFFVYKYLKISYISREIHGTLKNNENFYRDKSLLPETEPQIGLMLLSQPLQIKKIDHKMVLIDAIFYSWLSHEEHFRVGGLSGQSNKYTITDGRSLLILPMSQNSFIRDIDLSRLYSRDMDYNRQRTNAPDYDKLQDYVMSFILLDSYKEIYNHTLLDSPIKRQQIQYQSNYINIIG